jgi:biotin operon repressor
VIDSTEIFRVLLERVKKVIALDQEGRTHIMVPRERLTDSQQIALQLIGRKFAHTIDRQPKETMSAEELSKATGISYKAVTARVAGLKKQGQVDSDQPGQYRVVYLAMDEILSEIDSKLGG